MKPYSAIRLIYCLQDSPPLTPQYSKLAEEANTMSEDYCKDMTTEQLNAFNLVMSAISARNAEECELRYTQGFQLGLGLGYEA